MKTADEFVNDKLGEGNNTHSPFLMHRKELADWLIEFANQKEEPDKDCNNCKYEKLDPHKLPCRICLTSQFDYPKWEAKEEQK
jgi:hypothetical protein